MKLMLQNPTVRLWCLSGLTGMVLMAGTLLEDSQARTYTSSPIHTSLQASKLNLHMHSPETVIAGKLHTLKSGREHTPEISDIHKLVADKKPAKKRMGLAILFLRILAEKG